MRNKHSKSNYPTYLINAVAILLFGALFCWVGYKITLPEYNPQPVHAEANPASTANNGILAPGDYIVMNVMYSSFYGKDEPSAQADTAVFLVASKSGGPAIAVSMPQGNMVPSDWQTPDDYMLTVDSSGKWSFVPTKAHLASVEASAKAAETAAVQPENK